jgi:hypothetical protein
MPVRTTVDIPEPLHEALRHRSQQSGTSIRALIVRALDLAYGGSTERTPVTGPMVKGRGKLGPAFPTDENPHDVVFS